MILPKALFVIVQPAGIKQHTEEDGTIIEKTTYKGVPESCLCFTCQLNPNQKEFLEMSYTGKWKEIDPNLPGNEHYSCTVCGYPINEREVGE